MKKSRYGMGVIILSLLIALLLSIVPLPSWANWVRPLWVLMVLCYWTMALDDTISVGFAWLLGILLDILGGTLFGEHALVLCLCIFIITKLRQQIRLFPLWQQAIVIMLLSSLYQLGIYIIQGMLGYSPNLTYFWWPIITTAIFWPWLFILLRDSRRRFRVT